MTGNTETDWTDQKQRAAAWFRELRDRLCASMESLEPDGTTFERDIWQRGDGVEELPLEALLPHNVRRVAADERRDGAGSAVKMLVGSFVPLFGTARGQTLREWAHKQQIVLTWAMGAGTIDHRKALLTRSNRSFAGSVRILDVPTSGPLVNMSSSAADASLCVALRGEVLV